MTGEPGGSSRSGRKPTATMRQVVLDTQGPPEVMRLREAPVPEPGVGQVLVRVAAAGVNVIDLHQRSGDYTVQLPWTPGIEGSGEVVRLGPTVDEVAVGDRVAWAGVPGSYATHCVVPVSRLVPVPDPLPLSDAAAVLIHGMTADFLVSDVVAVGAGDTCLVHAAAGGVGGLLCQFASARGATVIGVVSRAEKEPVARAAGAGHVIVHPESDFVERVQQLTGGRGVDVVYDSVGQATFTGSLNCLRPRGTMVLYGQTSGPVTALDPQELNSRGSLHFTKPSLSHYDSSREQLLRRAERMFGALLSGELRIRLHRSAPLAEAADVHRALESRTVTGKLLLVP